MRWRAATRGAAVFELGEVDRVPQAQVQMRPLDPAHARRRRIEGDVTVLFTVTAQGQTAVAILVPFALRRQRPTCELRARLSGEYILRLTVQESSMLLEQWQGTFAGRAMFTR